MYDKTQDMNWKIGSTGRAIRKCNMGQWCVRFSVSWGDRNSCNNSHTTPIHATYNHYTRRLMFALNHSSPSYRPSPEVAQAAFGSSVNVRLRNTIPTWIYHVLCLRPWSPSLSVISAVFIAMGKSCLFANTSKSASRSSSSFNIRWSSSRASETRSRSFESTTKIMPCVFWKSKDDRVSLEKMELKGHVQCLHKGRILSWPPTSHTVKEMFLYSTVSTLNPSLALEWRWISMIIPNSPMVGIVVTISPSFNL